MKQRRKNAITALFSAGNKQKKLEYELHLLNANTQKSEEKLEYSPLITVFAKDAGKKLKASLEKQTYSKWELSGKKESASGDFVLLLSDDCVLEKDALYSFVEEINKNNEIDLLYADEDELNLNGERVNPFFKPDFSEVTMLSHNIIGEPLLISKKVFSKLNFIDMSNADSEYATALKCVAHSLNIMHIKKVLVSRGKKRGTVSKEGGFLAIKEYLQFKRLPRLMEEGLIEGTFRVSETSKKRNVLGIVILNGNDTENLRRLLESIEECMFNINKKIVVVSYLKEDAKTETYYGLLEKSKAAKIVRSEEKNYSKLCNLGAKECDCDVLLFLEPSVEFISPVHIKNLMDSVNDEKVGAVGCKILSSDGKIYDCGITVGLFGTFGNLYRGEDDDKKDETKNRFLNVKRAVSAVSSLCFMIRTDTFYNAGCFDETIKNPDAAVEFSLRLMRRGLYNIYDPSAVLIHYNGLDEWERSEADEMRMYDTLRSMLITGDPYYSLNYDYSVSTPKIAPMPYPPIELNSNYNKQ